MSHSSRHWLLCLSLSLAATAGCDRDAAQAEPQRLTVFAASSLTDVLADVGRDFEADHPGTTVVLSFAGSQVLRLQLEQGARADVFASADLAHLQALHQAGLAGAPREVAHNPLVVIVPPDNPAGIGGLGDVPRATRLVLGAAEVPVGRYTRRLLARSADVYGDDFPARVRARVASEESNVRLVRAKVELGEADAAIVYRSDAVASERVRAIELPERLQVRARYFVAVLHRAPHPRLAAAFVAHLRSPAGAKRLRQHGLQAVAP